MAVAPPHAFAWVAHVGAGSEWFSPGAQLPAFDGASAVTRAQPELPGMSVHTPGGIVAFGVKQAWVLHASELPK